MIREATDADRPAMAQVLEAAGRAAWGYIGPVERFVVEDVDLGDRAVVAVEDDSVAGFAVIKGSELAMLHVHPSAWGRGIGRALLAQAEDCGAEFLYTEERNERALRMDQAAGWHPDGGIREREWLGSPLRELRLRKRLG